MSKKHHDPPPKAVAMIDVRAEGSTAEVLIYDTIGADFWNESVTAKTFAKQVSDLKEVKEINVRINSPGGSVFDATAIYNTLKNHPANITVTIEGMALSAASLVAMAGDKISMAKNAFMMIHAPYTYTEGDAAAMRRSAELLDKIQSQLVEAYADRTGQSQEKISEMLNAETWLTAAEAVELGFADEILDQPAIAAHVDTNVFSRAPAAFKRMAKASAKATTAKEQVVMPEEPKAASIGEIKASCEGVTSDFVLAQIEKNATLPQALTAWTAVQAAELKRIKAELDEMKKEEEEAAAKAKEEEEAKAMEEEKKKEEEAATAKAKLKGGLNPIPSGQRVSNEGDDPISAYEGKLIEAKAKLPADKAAAKVAKEFPDLRAAYIEAINAKRR